ncbi:hypothetical protein ABZT34_42035 [Streptomyces sp. NPDC005329]|uniref:hypothetical protein n=1 Tax=Streptomyces sp. NPDC005329 TaxID=3157034 RepID=UPI0033B41359
MSALITSVAAVTSSGRAMVRRNQRVPAGTPVAGSPWGYQIHELPSREGASVRDTGAEIHRAVHWDASIRPVSHHDGGLHPETPPSASQTRTDQK